jgi:serine O-acetyltransferase
MSLSDFLNIQVEAFIGANGAAMGEIGIERSKFEDFADMASVILDVLVGIDAAVTLRVYRNDPALAEISAYDIMETARRNFEPDGAAATLMFSRGVHAVLAHRVAHALWQSGDQVMALAIKSIAGRALSTDIHPAAQIGRGLWLDHGLGFVVGETCIIGRDVSIWHNVTLGSTLSDSGSQRHPEIGDNVVIGAGAIILGNVKVGNGANVAAGAIVVSDVPEQTLVVGSKSRNLGTAQISFAPKKSNKS